MVHNGIEYGLMAAYAEGLNVIAKADAGKRQHQQDAETAPLETPEWYEYEIDTAEVAEVWRRGSVVASWLLDLAASALHASPISTSSPVESRTPRVAGRRRRHRGGRPRAGADDGAVLALQLAGLDDFADRLLSAMRKEFGGHDEKA